MKKRGLSLSFCVRDIMEGRVKLSDVEQIETGTMARTPEDWSALIDHYCTVYWRNDPALARAIVNHLRDNMKIYQPRNFGVEARNISAGHWEDMS